MAMRQQGMEVVGLVTSGTKAESTEPIFKALMAQRLQRDSPFLRPSALTWGGPRPERERGTPPRFLFSFPKVTLASTGRSVSFYL